MEMDNLQYKLIGIIFGTPRDIKEAREWLRRNEFEYIKLHKENDSYVIYYIRKKFIKWHVIQRKSDLMINSMTGCLF